MTLPQALAYFTREASLNLFRSWKVSALAVFTIAVSLFLAGAFVLATGNLRRVIDRWRAESKILIYLQPDLAEAELARVRRLAAGPTWVEEVELVAPAEAKRRFVETFPSLSDLLDGWGDEALPPSLEVSLHWAQLPAPGFEPWQAQLRDDGAVSMVDDDRDWLRQLETVVLVVRGLALVVGSVLLLTAIFTISSVIRLTAYLYREEIAVMRLVGATEFFIRGPFYVEGLLQGLAGGSAAVGSLFLLHTAWLSSNADSLLASVLAGHFLTARQILLLVSLGGGAGLIGAVSSLRRESLGAPGSDEEWATDRG